MERIVSVHIVHTRMKIIRKERNQKEYTWNINQIRVLADESNIFLTMLTIDTKVMS